MSSCRSQIPSGTARATRSRSYAYGKNKFFELLAAGRRQEAETVQRALPPIREREARQSLVDGVNHQTITNADRFVFSPFESADIAAKLQGESQTWVLCSRRLPLSRRATKTRRAGDLLLRPDQKSLKRKRHRRTESCTEVGHLIRFKWLASINTRRRIPPQLHADVLGK